MQPTVDAMNEEQRTDLVGHIHNVAFGIEQEEDIARSTEVLDRQGILPMVMGMDAESVTALQEAITGQNDQHPLVAEINQAIEDNNLTLQQDFMSQVNLNAFESNDERSALAQLVMEGTLPEREEPEPEHRHPEKEHSGFER